VQHGTSRLYFFIVTFIIRGLPAALEGHGGAIFFTEKNSTPMPFDTEPNAVKLCSIVALL
jgi:hypothetical protein